MYKTYDYANCLAPYIQGLIDEKRSLGFSYKTEAYILKDFDDYWNLDDPTGKSDDEFIKVIQEIEKRIKMLEGMVI